MSKPRNSHSILPPIRACIFDVDGLLVNSEDIYTDIFNNILRSYGKPDVTWTAKSKQQSGGRKGMLQFLAWAQLPITYDEWKAKISDQYALFKDCIPLPGVPELLSNLSSKAHTTIHLAIGSSATSETFKIKTSHLSDITSAIPPEYRVFGDDAAMSEAKKKPMPDVFLLALGRINSHLTVGERAVKPEECLVLEDSVAGVEAGRRAGMRVCWVPHKGLRAIWRGRENKVMEGRTDEKDHSKGPDVKRDEDMEQSKDGEEIGLWSEDGWAEMRMSLQGFDYESYGIRLKDGRV